MTSRLALLLAAIAATFVAFAAPAAAKSCDVGNTRGYGTTYVIEIGVKGVSCAKGKSVIRAYHACRPGKSGKCARVSRLRLHGEALQQVAAVLRLRRDVQEGRQARDAHLHPVHLSSKSFASACWTASAASAAPASLRWMPSGSRTSRSRPSTSIASR